MEITIKIIKESIKILLLASIISSIGGIFLQDVESIIIAVIPILIMLPALNDMVGDFGTTFSVKFTTLLYLGAIKKDNILKSKEVRNLIKTLYKVSIISALYMAALSLIIAAFKKFSLNFTIILKIFIITLIVTLVIITIIAVISLFLGVYVFKKKQDPNNFLIPVTTALGDLGNMFILSVLVRILF